MTAPLQLIALTFRLDADAESRLLAEVDRIEGRGVLRVLDMVVVAKGQDGTVEGLEVGDDEDFGSLLAGVVPSGTQNGGRPAGSGVAAVQDLADSLGPGNAVAFLLVEHLWAGPLVDAVAAAGGALISDDFLAGDTSLAVGAEVAAVEEASEVIAEAQAAEAAAVLRAVAAGAEAAEAEEASERIQEAAAADAVSALIAAGLIEAAAAHEAVTALTAAGLITDMAAQAADQAVADAAATIAAAGQVTDQAVAEDLALISAADDVTAEATEEAQARMRAASITRSEAQVLRYLPQPVPFSVIADKLGISRSAAKERAERLYQRLGVHSRDEAVSRARELGLLRG
ncbi:MAG TPA: LuxR C-terminal-related transcriptional regulator [Streptosporangiaceae bacterium]|nr:LuxR C-terminal-related transcriptional regulator [Streptosporangiaceae bacterium]